MKPLLMCCLALLLITPFNLFGQDSPQKADKIYDNLGYKTSIALYEQQDSVKLADRIRIANAYYLNHDTKNAERWYAQVVEDTKEPIHLLRYAQVLQSNQKQQLAKTYFLKYDEMVGDSSSDKRGELLAAAIDRMNEWKHTEVVIKNESELNSKKLDFSPTYYEDGIVFVTNRKPKSKNTNKDLWTNDNFMALYYADRNIDGTLGEPTEFAYNLSTPYHEGPLAFSRDGQRIFFTSNHFENGRRRVNKDGVMKLQIYTAWKDGEEWTNVEPLPFNTIEYEEVHPSLSPDELTIYFSSDRPDGYGGMDLYKSNFKNGAWSEPINLGAEINTPGNELFPFIHDDGTLYFASNGWGGLGGLDIFQVTATSDSTWAQAKNIGTPFNSPNDDFGYILNVLGTEGYFTSARDSGQGKDDIYSFSQPKADMPYSICVYDEATGQRIPDVKVAILKEGARETTNLNGLDNWWLRLVETEQENEFILKFKRATDDSYVNALTSDSIRVTDSTGQFHIGLQPNEQYAFVAKKAGYAMGKRTLSTLNAIHTETQNFCIPLEKRNCLSLAGTVKNAKFDNTIPNASVQITNLCTGEEEWITASADGSFFIDCLPCECEFVLSGNKKNFRSGQSTISTVGKNCGVAAELSTTILLTPQIGGENLASNSRPYSNQNPRTNPDIVATTPSTASINPSNPNHPSSSTNPNHPNNNNSAPEVIENSANFEGNELTIGAVIELKNIYYDFDKHHIREDADEDLDRVVALMYQYPGLVIELASHTDSRGRSSYNQKLSQRRADAAVKYIISKGIDGRRLVAKGYGEAQPRNVCIDGVDCTEEEHQYNRRTEIKVLYFDRKDVKVEYIDNKPSKVDAAPVNKK